MNQTKSWGGMQGREASQVSIRWKQELPPILNVGANSLLCFGSGRSYGDSCLPANGTALLMRGLSKLRSFDKQTGLLSAEAGLSLQELLDFSVPRGWFIPVSPGTKFVTLGGAIANDIHGKNHHRRGTFGRHVTEFELLRSTGESLICSPSLQQELFAATIGGLGLTGAISWCTLQLIPIQSALIEAEFIKTSGLDDFFELEETSAKDWEYTVSWIDCMAKSHRRGRGVFIRGNHAKSGDPAREYAEQSTWHLSVPFEAPNHLLNPLSIRIFNEFYYHKQQRRVASGLTAIDPFFYPLDKVLHWNRLYGSRGMLQYQVLLGLQQKAELIRIFDLIAHSGQGSFLGVLKKFGDLPSPGMLSFPREGYTLTLDFQNKGTKSVELFNQLDAVTAAAGGRLYPAKDSFMSPALFQSSYPNWREFSRFIDPRFRSLFWQRVTLER